MSDYGDCDYIYITFERCRSQKGVPKYMGPDWGRDREDWNIADALKAFIPLAEEAHPDHPHMWMPSGNPADYRLERLATPRSAVLVWKGEDG